MQSSYQETRLDRGLAIMAELSTSHFCISGGIIAKYIDGRFFRSEFGNSYEPMNIGIMVLAYFIILIGIEQFFILSRDNLAFLLMSLIFAVPFVAAISIAALFENNAAFELEISNYLLWGFTVLAFLQIFTLSILLFRRLRFSWHQKRAERA